jgi:hypothetical protein
MSRTARPYIPRAVTRGAFAYCRNLDELLAALALWAETAETAEERWDLCEELTYAAAVYRSRAADILALLR